MRDGADSGSSGRPDLTWRRAATDAAQMVIFYYSGVLASSTHQHCKIRCVFAALNFLGLQVWTFIGGGTAVLSSGYVPCSAVRSSGEAISDEL